MNKTLMIIFGCLVIFVATTIGSLLIFVMKKEISKKLNCIINGFSAGIMIAASVWSLILPSISFSENLGKLNFIPASVGILAGCFLILLIDIVIFFINKKQQKNEESLKLRRFVIAFTLHNIPEGMAVGFALGSALHSGGDIAIAGAIGLAIGIAIQNIPEGLAAALPVYKHTQNKNKAFLFGMLSGVVEPVFAFISVLLVSQIKVLLPWFLAFSAGSMIFVSVEDLIPDAKNQNSHAGTWGFIVGFLVMMILDVVLG